MDFQLRRIFFLLVISSLLFLQSRAESTGSVFFIDSPTHQFLRSPSSDDVVESDSMLLTEVGAAVSVLLGFAPPATLSAAGSSKLNEVLMPNPFDRPRAVFMLEVKGVEDSHLVVDPNNALFSNALKSKVVLGPNKAEIQLSDEDAVSVVSLDDPIRYGFKADCSDNDIRDFASWMGGSYVDDALEQLNGELTIPFANDAEIKLHMSKEADRKFIVNLLSLVRNIRGAMEMSEDLSQSGQSPAELLTGCFDGIKTLQEQYGHEGITQQGVGLLLATVSKIFDSLQAAHKGQIVGVVFFSGTPLPESETMLSVIFTSRSSPRWLVEAKTSPKVIIAEVVLVRLTLAWITGIILLISTLLGVYFLFYMPLTKDTLLYSNVKLD